MEMQITAEQIVKLIERKRDIHEHLMSEAYDRSDMHSFGNHGQRRDALQCLLCDIASSNDELKSLPTILRYLDTPFRHSDGREVPDWIIQGRTQY